MSGAARSRGETGISRLSPVSAPCVAVVVVHWINMDDTVECLESLSREGYHRLEVILVNNGSHDFDNAAAAAAFPGVRIVSSTENLGFAGGNNLGIARALVDGAAYVLLLNNDTTVRPGLAQSLLSAMQEREVGIVGPVIANYYQPDKIWFAGGRYSRLTGCSYRSRPLASFEGTRFVDWVNGCALFVRREVFENVGLLWDPFFLNFEEVDFCLRASKAGYKSLQVGQPLVSHKVSASGGVRGTDRFSPDKAYYFARNQVLLVRRNASGLWLLTGLVSQFVVALPYWALQCVLERNTKAMVHYVHGIWHGILGKGGPRTRLNCCRVRGPAPAA